MAVLACLLMTTYTTTTMIQAAPMRRSEYGPTAALDDNMLDLPRPRPPMVASATAPVTEAASADDDDNNDDYNNDNNDDDLRERKWSDKALDILRRIGRYHDRRRRGGGEYLVSFAAMIRLADRHSRAARTDQRP